MHFTFWGHYSHENGLNLLEIACFFGQFLSKVNIGLLKYLSVHENRDVRGIGFARRWSPFCKVRPYSFTKREPRNLAVLFFYKSG